VSLFVLSPEIEDRVEVEVATGRSTKRPFALNDIQGVSKWLGINFRVNSLRKMWLKT
jgi:hypothetical protein